MGKKPYFCLKILVQTEKSMFFFPSSYVLLKENWFINPSSCSKAP